MSNLYTLVSQKGLKKNLYSAALMATTTVSITLFAASAKATETQGSTAAAPTAAAATSTVSPDMSIFSGCSIDELKLSNRTEWVNKNSYDIFKRNMTVEKTKQVEEKIKEMGAQNYVMNDPGAKKDLTEQIALRTEFMKIQGDVYKCLNSNVAKLAPSDLQLTRGKIDKATGIDEGPEKITGYPIKTLALQMALQSQMNTLASSVNNYSKDCIEKSPTTILYIDSPACDTKFQRSTNAQILLTPYAQMRADLDVYASGKKDKIFQNTIDAQGGSLAMLEKERTSLQAGDKSTSTSVTTAPAKPAIN